MAVVTNPCKPAVALKLVTNLASGLIVRGATPEESRRILSHTVDSGRYAKDWDSGQTFVLFHDNDGVVGWVRHWSVSTGRHIVMNVTVDEAWRGLKRGLALVSHMTQSLPGVLRWHLDCQPSLASYYGQIGFQCVPRTECPELFDDGCRGRL